MARTLIDAGPMIALFDSSDHYHGRIKTFLRSFTGQLVTTWPVVTETLHMLDFDIRAQLDFLRWLEKGAVTIYTLTSQDLAEIIQLTEKYQDRPMDFADATLLVAAQTQGITDIITIDSDFFIYRVKRKEMLRHIFNT